MTVALIVASLVLCSAATASAAFLITGKRIKDETVTGRDIRDHSLTSGDLRGPVRGPTGPSGPQGIPGPAGAQGLPGDAAISAPVVVTASGTIGGLLPGTVTAVCPTDMVAVGGGGFSEFAEASIKQSAPQDATGHGWMTTFFNVNPDPITVTAAVVCVTAH